MTAKEDLVSVHHATSPSEAEVVRSLLESAGIYAMIPDRNMPLPGVDLTPFNDNSGVAGCEVCVARSDVERARQAIREARESGEAPDDGDE